MYLSALTNVGLIRKDNEDSYLASAERGLFVVADGMGGHVGGQIASSMAIKVIDEEIREILSGQNPGEMLLNALLKANEMIFRRGLEEHYHGMGTTVTGALYKGQTLAIAHIGDSRAYLFRAGKVTQLTQDHSLVNELLQNGSLTREEAQNHPQRNILTRALGTHENPQVDLLTLEVLPGDSILLCTDGLHNHLSESDLKMILQFDMSLPEKNDMMVKMALERGGTDNVTVVLAAIT